MPIDSHPIIQSVTLLLLLILSVTLFWVFFFVCLFVLLPSNRIVIAVLVAFADIVATNMYHLSEASEAEK